MAINIKNNFTKPTKTKFIFCLCWSFVSVYYSAQTLRLDSISIDDSEKNLRITNPEIAFSNPIFFSDAFVFLETQDLNFKRVQTPESSLKYGFGASGIFQFNPKLILSGALEVSREDEKSVPYILTDERTTHQNYISNPSYFYAPRKSDWQKQNYKIFGNLAYQPIKNIFLVAGVDGEFQKSYANSDPRPEIGNFKYEAEGKIGYQFHKHRIFAKASYFNRRKDSDIMYLNSDMNAPNYFETYIRFNKGYGNYYYSDKYSENFYQYDGISYGGEYNFVGEKKYFRLDYKNEYFIDRMTRNYSYQARDENNVLQYYYDRLKLTGLKTERNTISADYIGNLGQWKWNSSLKFSDQKDINYDYVNFYTSYRAYNTEINFKNIWQKYNSKNEMLRLGFAAIYGNQDIKDISVVLQKKLSFLDYKIFAEKEFRISENQKFAVGINQSLYLPLEKSLLYVPYQSSQENVFVKNIVMPDYYYDTSSRFGLGMNLRYTLDRKSVRYEIFAKENQDFFLNNENKDVKNIINTNSNFFFNFGLNIYY